MVNVKDASGKEHPFVNLEVDAMSTQGKITIGGVDYSGYVTHVAFDHGAGEIPTLTLTLGMMPLSTHGQMRVKWLDGMGRKIKHIEFEDGHTFGMRAELLADANLGSPGGDVPEILRAYAATHEMSGLSRVASNLILAAEALERGRASEQE